MPDPKATCGAALLFGYGVLLSRWWLQGLQVVDNVRMTQPCQPKPEPGARHIAQSPEPGDRRREPELEPEPKTLGQEIEDIVRKSKAEGRQKLTKQEMAQIHDVVRRHADPADGPIFHYHYHK